MKHQPDSGPSPRPPLLSRARVAVVITATAGLALVAACGGSPSSTASAGTPSPGSTAAEAVAYSQCMRTHGVPEYPGPDSNGQLQKISSGQQVGVSDSALSTAGSACQSLWPYQALTPAEQQQQLTDDLKFAQCMRSNGVPTLPDPVATNGRVEFVISVSRDGFNPESPQILAKAHACQHVLPAGAQLPSAVVTP
ncbi:MAG: hypothetical protein ACRDNO_07950 [Trebonia sp.]